MNEFSHTLAGAKHLDFQAVRKMRFLRFASNDNNSLLIPKHELKPFQQNLRAEHRDHSAYQDQSQPEKSIEEQGA